MSNPAFSENHSAARRARRVVARPVLSVVAPPASVRTAALGAPRTIEGKWDWSLLLAAAAIVLLHVGVVFYLMHRPTDVVTTPAPPPVSVELVQPQIVQPPKPLPQKKQAPPPRLPNPPRAPHVERPPPATVPATPITPQTPVVQMPPPPQQTPVIPSQLPVTAAVGYAGYLNNPAPDYPQFAQDQGWEGHIVLHVHVLADGHPDSVLVKISSNRKILDEAAQHAVQRWLFSPAKRGETAVEGWVDVPIDFKLST